MDELLEIAQVAPQPLPGRKQSSARANDACQQQCGMPPNAASLEHLPPQALDLIAIAFARREDELERPHQHSSEHMAKMTHQREKKRLKGVIEAKDARILELENVMVIAGMQYLR